MQVALIFTPDSRRALVAETMKDRVAETGRSLSAIVAEFLDGFAAEESEFERLKRMEHELRAKMDAKGLGLRASERLSRDALYDERFCR